MRIGELLAREVFSRGYQGKMSLATFELLVSLQCRCKRIGCGIGDNAHQLTLRKTAQLTEMSSTPLRRRVLGTLRAYLCLRCCVFCSRNAAAGQDGSTADTNDNQQESIGNAQNSADEPSMLPPGDNNDIISTNEVEEITLMMVKMRLDSEAEFQSQEQTTLNLASENKPGNSTNETAKKSNDQRTEDGKENEVEEKNKEHKCDESKLSASSFDSTTDSGSSQIEECPPLPITISVGDKPGCSGWQLITERDPTLTFEEQLARTHAETVRKYREYWCRLQLAMLCPEIENTESKSFNDKHTSVTQDNSFIDSAPPGLPKGKGTFRPTKRSMYTCGRTN